MQHVVTAEELLHFLVETESGEKLGYLDQIYLDDQCKQVTAFRVNIEPVLHRRNLILSPTLVSRTDLSSRRIFLKDSKNHLLAGTKVQELMQPSQNLEFLRKCEIQTLEKSFGKVGMF
jgi:hypothetical protein